MMVQGNYLIDQPEENLTGRAVINFLRFIKMAKAKSKF